MNGHVRSSKKQQGSTSSTRRGANSTRQTFEAKRSRHAGKTSAAREKEARGPGKTKRRTRKATQEALPFRNWGGARPGAGRKRKADRPRVPHRLRGKHVRSVPVQVTSRLVPGLRSLRSAEELAIVRDALARSQRDEFQVVHHSIQSNHLHLIVEADDRGALTSGLRGLLVRLAAALNRLWRRRGGVFADRFHERELRTPREVRNSLLYVLHNARKHGIWMRGPDPCSSGVEFDGWEPSVGFARSTRGESSSARTMRGSRDLMRTASREVSLAEGRVLPEEQIVRRQPLRSEGRTRDAGLPPVLEHRPRPGSAQSSGGSALARTTSPSGLLRRARTWLLGVGWRRHGLLRETEVPHGAFGSIVCRIDT